MTRPRNFDPTRLGIYFLLVLFALLFFNTIYVLKLVSSLKSFVEVQDQSHWWRLPSACMGSFVRPGSGIPRKACGVCRATCLVVSPWTIPARAGLRPARALSMATYFLSELPGARIVFPFMLLACSSLSEHPHSNDPNAGLHWPGRNPVGLFLVHVVYGLPLTTLIFRNYYILKPKDLVEAAAMDGADIMDIYWQIILSSFDPPVLSWSSSGSSPTSGNEISLAISILQKPDLQRSRWPCKNLIRDQIQEWNMVMAGAIITLYQRTDLYAAGTFFYPGLVSAFSPRVSPVL